MTINNFFQHDCGLEDLIFVKLPQVIEPPIKNPQVKHNL